MLIRTSLLVMVLASAIIGHLVGKFLYEEFPSYGLTGAWFGYFWSLNAAIFTAILSRLVNRTGIILLATVPILAYFWFAAQGLSTNMFGLDLKRPGTGFQWSLPLGVFDVFQIPVISAIVLVLFLIPIERNALDSCQSRMFTRVQLVIIAMAFILHFFVLSPLGDRHRSPSEEEWSFIDKFKNLPCRISFKRDSSFGTVFQFLVLDKNLGYNDLENLIDQLVEKVPRNRPIVITIRANRFDFDMLKKLIELENLCRLNFPDDCIKQFELDMLRSPSRQVYLNGTLLE